MRTNGIGVIRLFAYAVTVSLMSDAGDPPKSPRLNLQVPDPEDRNATAAERLTNAVICLLIERATPLIAEALKPEDVTKRAGKSRASYYRTEGFPASESQNHEARVAVLERTIAKVLDDSATDLAQVVGGIGDYIANGWVSESPREFMGLTAAANFDTMSNYDAVLQLFAGAMASSSPATEAALQDYYRRVTSSYSAAYAELMSFWEYRFRPPITVEKFTIALMAMAEGLMLRHFGNGDIDQELFAELLSAVATLMIVADGDVSEVPVPPEHDLPGEVAPPNRAAIIATLIRTFEHERATLPTVEELARAAGCTPQTIRSQFGGVVGVVRAAWEEWMPEFEEAAERNRALMREPDPLNVLYRVAVAVATRAAEQQSLTRALLMSEIGIDPLSDAGRPEAISKIFERLLVEAGTLGHFRVPSIHNDVVGRNHPLLFARSLRTSILNIVVSHPVPAGFSPSEHGRWCVDYVWALLMPPRQQRQ